MSPQNEAPARAGSAETEAETANSLAALRGFDPKPLSSAAQAAIVDLSLEYATEAAWIASAAARHFAENIELGRMAEADLACAVAHLREAAAQFRVWQGAAQEGGTP